MFKKASGTLTAPGQTVIAWNDDSTNVTCQYTITSINTSVTLLLEASTDGTQWDAVDPSGTSVTYVSNVTDTVVIRDSPFTQYRLTFVSEVGGTAAVVNVTFLLS